MNKSIQVVITSILLIAVFFAAALTWESCTGKKTNTIDDKVDATMEKHGGEYFEDELTEDDDTYETEDDNSTDFSDESDLTVNYSEADDKITSEEKNVVTSYEEETPVRRSTMQGKHLVVAGNFLVENNANDMVDKLVGFGYNSAEVAIFDYSQYYTVIASRSDDYALAKSLSYEIKTKGIDCYVHTRK
ncbi:MAG: SPOR domain-containing protein [Saprospiraceae bacterium]